MGLLKKFFNQTRKPNGFLGKIMLNGMNSGHEKMALYGISKLDGDYKKIAELGCGGGANIKRLLDRFKDSYINAIDYSELSVSKAIKFNKKRLDRCSIKKGDVSKLELEKNYFDLATAFETVYFWPGIEACFKNVYDILNDNGIFMICNEADGTSENDRKWEEKIECMKSYTKDELEAALKKAGFKDVITYHHDTKPWMTLIAKK